MSVAAAVRLNSHADSAVVERAAAFAANEGEDFYVISIVDVPPDGTLRDEEMQVILHNLDLLATFEATPVIQEGTEIARALLTTARWFGVRTLFLQNGRRRLLRRSIAEKLVAMSPPFEVVVLERR